MKHTYTVEICRAVFEEEAFDVFCKYEASIHKKFEKSKRSYDRFLCQSPLYDPSSQLAEDKFSPWSNDVDKNRSKKPIPGNCPPVLGSYHMRHYIDGKLFMVGVLDYTDFCVSSVYLFYDPKFEFLSPGTLSAVREIEHVRKLMTTGQMKEGF